MDVHVVCTWVCTWAIREHIILSCEQLGIVIWRCFYRIGRHLFFYTHRGSNILMLAVASIYTYKSESVYNIPVLPLSFLWILWECGYYILLKEKFKLFSLLSGGSWLADSCHVRSKHMLTGRSYSREVLKPMNEVGNWITWIELHGGGSHPPR